MPSPTKSAFLSGETAFTEKVVGFEDRDNGFLSVLRNDGDFCGTFLDVEDRIGIVALREHDLRLAIVVAVCLSPFFERKAFRSKCGLGAFFTICPRERNS